MSKVFVIMAILLVIIAPTYEKSFLEKFLERF